MAEARDIARMLVDVAQNATAGSGTNVTGTVEKVDNGTAYVRFDGASELTPVSNAMAAGLGDSVTVMVHEGRAVVTGNLTHPATDDTVAMIAAQQASAVKGIANEAMAIAEATGQHFWDDENGAHVTDVTRDEWEEAVEDGFSDLSDSKPYHNALWNSLGMLFRRALYNLVSISRSAIAFFDGEGNDAENIVAQFGVDGAQVGIDSKSHVNMTSEGIYFSDVFGEEAAHIGSGTLGVLTDSITLNDRRTFTTAHAVDFTAGNAALRITYKLNGISTGETFSFAALGRVNGFNYAATLTSNGASNSYRVTITKISDGNTTDLQAYKFEYCYWWAYPHFSFGTTSGTMGDYAFSHGQGVQASGTNSYAGGKSCVAAGDASHAEGYNTSTFASAEAAHVEGFATQAQSNYSHAQGRGTIANWEAQTALGRFNVTDANKAVILGNGTSNSARSNALTVDWQGNVACGEVNGVDMADVVVDSDLAAVATSGSYNDLSNKPTILGAGDVPLLKGATLLASGTDLNGIVDTGTYYATSNNAANITNCPVAGAFKLYVERTLSTATYLKQRFELYNAVNQWVRFSTNGGSSWNAWYREAPHSTQNATANQFLATPNGSAGLPSYRAIAAADIPSLGAGKITSGTFDDARIPDMPERYAALKGGTELKSTDNLNDVKTLGTYYVTGSSNTPQNAPTGFSVGKVIVDIPHGYSSSAIRGQHYISYSTGREAYRKFESGSWSEWQYEAPRGPRTPQTYDVKSLITQTSTQSGNFTISAASLVVSGFVAMLTVDFTIGAALTANTEYSLGTLPTSIRPAARANAGIGDSRFFAAIASGTMYLRPQAATSAGTSTYRYNSTYIMSNAYTG